MPDSIDSRKYSILLVDDSSVNHMLINSALKHEYKLLGAYSGTQLWETLQNSKPNLILMDVMMPDDDGFQLTRALTQHSDYSDIPVIFLTAKDSSADLKKGFDSGGMDYIKKPFNSVELKARIRSVLKIKALEKELKIRSVTDPLTQLFNRRYFFEVAVKELDRVTRGGHPTETFSIAIIDLDFFKQVNDSFGHQAGDFLLREFAQLLQQNIRKYDISARYGGEEFVILFINTSLSKAYDILARLKTTFSSTTYHFGSCRIMSSFSCGLVQLEECLNNPITIDHLVKIADNRLYSAKEKGRNRIEYKDSPPPASLSGSGGNL